MKIIFPILLLSFLATASLAHADVASFESCYLDRAKKIPSVPEREFLDSYLLYLKKGTRENGILAIEKMKALAKSQGGKFSTEWVGIFEGTRELCCGGPQECTQSFGSASLSALWPRVEQGRVTALNLVLTYEQLAKTDGAEASGLNDYLKVIREKHPWAIRIFKRTN